MRAIDLIHRWAGGVIGLILAVLGLSGAILAHKEEWIALPHAGDALVTDPAPLGDLAQRLMQGAAPGDSFVFANDRFGLVQARSGDAGYYASQTGEVVSRWASKWERPELWLFDLHHHLFSGDTGEAVAGTAGLAAILFVITGAILWWRTRRTFRFRLWPARMTGPAIRMQHRDLGIIASPLLFLLALTGTMLIFRPVAQAVLAPLGGASTISAELKAPELSSGPLSSGPLSAGPHSAGLDWRGIVATAHARFPDARLRTISLPRKAGAPITIRMRRAAEWLPNGRTTLWFDAADGAFLAERDALSLSPPSQAFNMVYPIHAAKVGGLAWRIAITLAGLAMAVLGTFAVWSFWRPRPRR